MNVDILKPAMAMTTKRPKSKKQGVVPRPEGNVAVEPENRQADPEV